MQHKMDKELQKEFNKIEDRMSLENREGELRRARSVTVGTCFGGTTELMMRGNDGNVVFAPMQPVEVVELIHQLAANIGCHIHLQPRDDFASWRDWRVSDTEKNHLNHQAPFPNDMISHMNTGANLPKPEEQPGLQPQIMAKQETENVAIEKTVNKRNTRRAKKTS